MHWQRVMIRVLACDHKRLAIKSIHPVILSPRRRDKRDERHVCHAPDRGERHVCHAPDWCKSHVDHQLRCRESLGDDTMIFEASIRVRHLGINSICHLFAPTSLHPVEVI